MMQVAEQRKWRIFKIRSDSCRMNRPVLAPSSPVNIIHPFALAIQAELIFSDSKGIQDIYTWLTKNVWKTSTILKR